MLLAGCGSQVVTTGAAPLPSTPPPTVHKAKVLFTLTGRGSQTSAHFPVRLAQVGWFLSYSYRCEPAAGRFNVTVLPDDQRFRGLSKDVHQRSAQGSGMTFEYEPGIYRLQVTTSCSYIIEATDGGDSVLVIK